MCKVREAGVKEMNDPINHPKHYTDTGIRCECGKEIEVIKITETLDFCLGNAIKYILRAGKKNNAVEDLEKAVWYINHKIDMIEKRDMSTKECF